MICLSIIGLVTLKKISVQEYSPWINTTQLYIRDIFSQYKSVKRSNESIVDSLDGVPLQLYTQSIDYQKSGKFNESLLLLTQAHKAAESLYGSQDVKTIFLMVEVARCYKYIGKNIEATSYYQAAVDGMDKAGVELPNTLDLLKELFAEYYAKGDFAKALPIQSHIVDIEENLRGVKKFELATSIMNLGYLKLQLGQFSEAILLDQRALALFDQIQFSESSNAILLRNHLGLAYIAMGDNDHAISEFKNALNIQNKNSKEELINGFILNNMSLVSHKKGQYREEVAFLEQALVIYSKFEPQGGINTLTALNNLIKAYQEIGDYKGLLTTQEKVVNLDKTLFGLTHTATVNAMTASAATLMIIGRYADASFLFKSIEEIYAKNAPTNPMRFYVQMLQGGVLYKLGDKLGANVFLTNALELTQKNLGQEHVISNILMGAAALTDIEVGKIDHAADLSARMLTFFEKTPPIAIQVSTNVFGQLGLRLALFVSGKVKLAQLKYSEAISFQAKSFALDFITTGVSGNQIRSDRLHELSKTMYKLNPNAAIALSKSGINISQSLRSDVSSAGADNMSFFTKSIKDRYQFLAEMLINERRLAEANEVIDLLKINEINQYTRGAEPQDPLMKRLAYTDDEKKIIAPYESLAAKIMNQSIKLKELNDVGKAAADNNLRTAIAKNINDNQEKLIVVLRSMADPATQKTTAVLQSTPDSTEYLKQLQDIIQRSGTDVALVRYYISDDNLGVIVTGAKDQWSKNLPINNAELHRKITSFNQILRNPKLDPKPIAHELYKLIFEPVVGTLEKAGVKTVTLSLDGILRYIPFAALYDGKQYLVEKYRLPIYTAAARDRLDEKTTQNWQVAAMGLSESIDGFPALPGVKTEIEGIVLQGHQGVMPGKIFLNKDFTALSLMDASKQDYQVMHIASHFVFSPGTEVNSFLLMGDGQELTLADIRAQKFDFSHIDLLTLSACETGMGGGEDANGSEIEGFGVTAQRQGAKSVLATLWPVADKSTSILMQNMYRLHQEQHLSKAEALRQVQLFMIKGNSGKTKNYSHPFYWAPFILMGNWL